MTHRVGPKKHSNKKNYGKSNLVSASIFNTVDCFDTLSDYVVFGNCLACHCCCNLQRNEIV